MKEFCHARPSLDCNRRRRPHLRRWPGINHYRFFRSVNDAAGAARDPTTTSFTLNVALGRVQESLLHPRIVASSDDEQVAAFLEACLSSCTALFGEVQLEVEKSGLAEDQLGLAKKACEFIKWSFNDEEVHPYIAKVDAEKTTAPLTVDICSELGANVLGQVAETGALVGKQDRRLKDIHVFCKWVVGQQRKGGQRSPSDGSQRIATSPFAAFSAYNEGDIARLVQSSESVLSITLGAPVDKTLGAVWTPDPGSRVPLRRSITPS